MKPISKALAVGAMIIAPLTYADPGRTLASQCANCHGTNGKSQTSAVPTLAGVKAETIVEAMQAFRDGKRPATIMHQLSKGYTDEQVKLMADFFAKQK